MLLWCIILINLRFTSGSNSKRAAGCQNKQKYGPDLLLCSPAMQYKGVMKYLHDLNKIFYGLQYQQQRDVLSLTIIACPCFNADVSYLYRKTTDADLTNQKMTFLLLLSAQIQANKRFSCLPIFPKSSDANENHAEARSMAL